MILPYQVVLLPLNFKVEVPNKLWNQLANLKQTDVFPNASPRSLSKGHGICFHRL